MYTMYIYFLKLEHANDTDDSSTSGFVNSRTLMGSHGTPSVPSRFGRKLPHECAPYPQQRPLGGCISTIGLRFMLTSALRVVTMHHRVGSTVQINRATSIGSFPTCCCKRCLQRLYCRSLGSSVCPLAAGRKGNTWGKMPTNHTPYDMPCFVSHA